MTQMRYYTWYRFMTQTRCYIWFIYYINALLIYDDVYEVNVVLYDVIYDTNALLFIWPYDTNTLLDNMTLWHKHIVI